MKRPLVFYTISTATGCLSAMEYFDNFTASAFIAVIFFAIYAVTLNKKFFLLNTIFFFLAVFSTVNYFTINPGKNIEVRIIQKKNYYFIGNFKGRKIILKGDMKGVELGKRIWVQGNFRENREFYRGIIGEYTINNYKILKNDIISYSYGYKRTIYHKFKNILGEERSALVMGICYGDIQYLTEDQNKEFQKMGVVHAVSVSGFHMAVIYQVLEKILGLKASIAVSAIYVVFTGMSAATVRSFIMILVFKLSTVFLREYDSVSSLSLAAVILMMVKPYYIVDIGFGLSFLSTLGIILYYKKLLKAMYVLPERLNQSISITLSSQIYSMPYIAFTIQNFSYGFILGNLFLLPLYSIIVILGNTALISVFIKSIFDFISLLLKIVIIGCEGANSIILQLCPEIVYMDYIQGLVLLCVYMSYIFYVKGYKNTKCIPALMFIVVIFQVYTPLTQITFINSQNGEAVILNSGFNRIMMCNYDPAYSKWILNVKEHFKIDKIITNPHRGYVHAVGGDNSFTIGYTYQEGSVIGLYHRGKYYKFIFNNDYTHEVVTLDHNNLAYIPKIKSTENVLDEGTTYVIIFNRIIPLKKIGV